MTTIRLRHVPTGHLLVEPFTDAAGAATFARAYLSHVAGRYVPVEVARDAVCDCLLCAATRKNETLPPMRGVGDCGPGCARMGHDHRMCLAAAEPTDAELRDAEAERAIRRAAAFCDEDTDRPRCVSPVIQWYATRINDLLDDADRQRLVPYLLDCVGTNTGPEDDVARVLLCADYAVRKFAPPKLRAAGLGEHAARLESCEPITDTWTAQAAAKVAATVYGAAVDAAPVAATAASDAVDVVNDAVAGDRACAIVCAAMAYTWPDLALELLAKLCAVGRRPVPLVPEREAVLRAATAP